LVISLKSQLSQAYEDRPDEVFALPKHTNATHRSCSSTSTHTSDAREGKDLKGNVKVGRTDEHVTGEMEATVEGEDDTKVPHSHSHLVQLTRVQGEATRELTKVPATTLASSTTLQPSSPAPYTLNTERRSPKEPPSPIMMDDASDTSSGAYHPYHITVAYA
jgi:hypothetical protein